MPAVRKSSVQRLSPYLFAAVLALAQRSSADQNGVVDGGSASASLDFRITIPPALIVHTPSGSGWSVHSNAGPLLLYDGSESTWIDGVSHSLAVSRTAFNRGTHQPQSIILINP